MRHPEAEKLLEKYKNRSITPKELQLLEAWYNERAEKGTSDISERELEENLNQLWLLLSVDVTPRKGMLWKRIAVAAAVLLVLGISWYAYKSGEPHSTNQQIVDSDIVPGGNRAFLTLANGKKLLLGTAVTGTLAKEAGVVISESAEGQLVYTISGDNKENDIKSGQYNTIETPKGGQYEVVLPDGTHIWLNAASVLKYPVRFAKTERTVELIGEAYFEVAKDSAKPFIVRAADQVVNVLGTHFNINGYPDEKIWKATLLEGAVQISSKGNQAPVTLKPGEEYESEEGKVSVREVNAFESIAWKNGEFVFNDEPLESIMNKIARWYDVNIIYENINPATRFGGTVSRFTQVSKVLEKLELTGEVSFRIKGRSITVTK